MKRICAWCGKELGAAVSSVHSGDAVSHGICPECTNKLRLELHMPIDRFIEQLPAPVLATEIYNGRVIVKAANGPACAAVGKELREVVQHLAGNVFECGNARLPEGCGRTIHCSGCAIRRAVLRTWETGEPQSMVPATFSRADADDPASVTMHITTVKIGELVALRIDRREEREDRVPAKDGAC